MASDAIDTARHVYNELISMTTHEPVAREQARMVLPVAQMSEMYATVNLHNLFHFLRLRLHEHSQIEIQEYAQAIDDILKEMEQFKWSYKAFHDTLSMEYAIMKALNRGKSMSDIRKLVEEM